jgi:hypothetical protein
MRARLAALIAAANLVASTSTVDADILCAVKVGFSKDMLRDRPGPICPIGERPVDPRAVGLQGPAARNPAKGVPIYDCSTCAEGRLSLLSTCEFLEPTGGFGHPPGDTAGVQTATKPCKLVGYLMSP